MPLAEASPSFSPQDLFAVCGVLTFILTSVLLVRKVFGHQPPLHKEYVTKIEHDRLAERVDHELGRERGSRKAMYEKIEGLGRSTAAIAAETNSQSKDLEALKLQIADMNGRMDEIPRRTISMLRETQQLHKG